jgi:hypothetical protein
MKDTTMTPFSKKVEILNDFYIDYSGSGEYDDFIQLNDLGFPAAVLSIMGAATITDIGEGFIEQTWVALCELLVVDHHGEYDSLDDLMEMSDE